MLSAIRDSADVTPKAAAKPAVVAPRTTAVDASCRCRCLRTPTTATTPAASSTTTTCCCGFGSPTSAVISGENGGLSRAEQSLLRRRRRRNCWLLRCAFSVATTENIRLQTRQNIAAANAIYDVKHWASDELRALWRLARKAEWSTVMSPAWNVAR